MAKASPRAIRAGGAVIEFSADSRLLDGQLEHVAQAVRRANREFRDQMRFGAARLEVDPNPAVLALRTVRTRMRELQKGVVVAVKGNVAPLQEAIRSTQVNLEHLRSGARRVARDMAIATTAMAGLFAFPIREAAKAEEALNRFAAVFGDQTQQAAVFAERLAQQIGRSPTVLKSAMSSFQSVFQGLEIPRNQSRELTQIITTLAQDFGSFFNLSEAESNNRLISALSGSAEVLDQFGVNLRAAALEQEMFRLGINKTVLNATEAEKALARVSVIQNTLARIGATGDAERTRFSFANQMRELLAQSRELAIVIGTGLTSAIGPYLQKLNAMIKTIRDFAAENRALVGSITAVSVALTGSMAVLAATGMAVSLAARGFLTLGTAIRFVLPYLGKLAAINRAELATSFATTTKRALEAAVAFRFKLYGAATGAALGMRALVASSAAFIATPVGAALAAAGVAAAGLYLVTRRTAESLDAVVMRQDALYGGRAKERAEDVGKLRRLEELAKKHRLTNGEMEEAVTLSRALQQSYGTVAASLDRTTNSVQMAAGAFEQLSSVMRKQAIEDTKKQIEELADLREQLVQSDAAAMGFGPSADPLSKVMQANEVRQSGLYASQETLKAEARLLDLRGRLIRLMRGDNSAMPENGGNPFALDNLPQITEAEATAINRQLQRAASLMERYRQTQYQSFTSSLSEHERKREAVREEMRLQRERLDEAENILRNEGMFTRRLQLQYTQERRRLKREETNELRRLDFLYIRDAKLAYDKQARALRDSLVARSRDARSLREELAINLAEAEGNDSLAKELRVRQQIAALRERAAGIGDTMAESVADQIDRLEELLMQTRQRFASFGQFGGQEFNQRAGFVKGIESVAANTAKANQILSLIREAVLNNHLSFA